MPTFDGDNLVMTLDAVTSQDVISDWYEPWKDWMLASPVNRGYPQLFLSEGGGSVNATLNQGSYIRVNNSFGWRIRPPEQDIEITYTGNLVRTSDSLPIFIPTIGNFSTQVFNIQPITTQSIFTTGSVLSPGQEAKLDQIHGNVNDIEGGMGLAMYMRALFSVSCADVTGAETNVTKFWDRAKSKVRVTSTTDEHGNRTVTWDMS